LTSNKDRVVAELRKISDREKARLVRIGNAVISGHGIQVGSNTKIRMVQVRSADPDRFARQMAKAVKGAETSMRSLSETMARSFQGVGKSAGMQSLADRFSSEMSDSLMRQSTLLGMIHYGDCSGDGCEACAAMEPAPLSRRRRAINWMRETWFGAWSLVHRMIPGECPCEYCDDGEIY
jgi:hypothetical protein